MTADENSEPTFHTERGHGNGHGHGSGVRNALLPIFRPHSHDATDLVDSALEASADGVRAVKVSLLARLLR